MKRSEQKQVSYSDFMRARRPELFSDTLVTEEGSMDRQQFEYHLDSLTQRKQEAAFETFARALAEKELCPNLLPQTGPTGGGDSKVDTETYPVSEAISERWYEAEAQRAGTERWAFAISAKKAWKPKVQSDVQKIIDTGRPYTVIYFISNQAIRDKDRASIEDDLSKKYSRDVRLLDRSWIIERVSSGRRWDLVAETLHLDLRRETKRVHGPHDAERLRDLEVLDARIEGAGHDLPAQLQLIEDCLRAALLARGLERARTEIDGRFDRAERVARKINATRQLQQIWYQRAWTAIWWFDDQDEAVRIYDQLAQPALGAEWIWELEDLVNLWLAAIAGRVARGEDADEGWGQRTSGLRTALQRHIDDHTGATNSLWARAQILLMDLTSAAKHREQLAVILPAMQSLLEEAKHHVEFPTAPLIRLVREMAMLFGDDPAYDALSEAVIDLQSLRHGQGSEGELRLERGQQKLAAGKTYDAIDQFAKAQILLAQDELKDKFVAALAGTGLAYEAAGLLWAARANLVAALDRRMYAFVKVGEVDDRALPLMRRLIWLELQLGRVPYALCWIEWLHRLKQVVNQAPEAAAELDEELEAMDRVLGVLILRTQASDWPHLERIPDELERLGLVMSRCAALFMLGHEDRVRQEYETQDDDLQDMFSRWIQQPAAEDLPTTAQWHADAAKEFVTVVLGCKVTFIARGPMSTALLTEGLIAFLESFFSTALQIENWISPRAELIIEVRQAEQAKAPFSLRFPEDDCGETKIIVSHPVGKASDLIHGDGFRDAVNLFFAHVAAELQLGAHMSHIEELFAKHRAQDRAMLCAQAIVATSNILGDEPKGRALHWNVEAGAEHFPYTRPSPWCPTDLDLTTAPSASAPNQPSPVLSNAPAFGVDGLKHRDLLVMSPINIPVWDKARWNGVAFAMMPTLSHLPRLLLIYEDLEQGRKIFRGWHKRTGPVDSQNWISVTIVTGISRAHPAHYRMVIGVNESYVKAHVGSGQRFAMVNRMQDMTPSSDANLQTFMSIYARTSKFVLQPGTLGPDGKLLPSETDVALGIELRHMAVMPAWQIEAGSPLMVALGGIDDPFIPDGISDPPIVRALEARKRHQ